MGVEPGSSAGHGRRAVFLDRDDTLVACNTLPAPPPPAARGDLVDPALVRLLPGVAEGCTRLKRGGFVLVIVSNQGVVARGGLGVEGVERVNRRVARLLGDAGAGCEAAYFCPFHPRGARDGFTAEHAWRKPGAGMFAAAARDLALELSASWMIGDASRDREAALAAGISPERIVLVGADGGGTSFAEGVARVLAGA